MSAVAMLDLDDKVLHRPGPEHLVTLCGKPLERCTVGPLYLVSLRSQATCLQCLNGLSVVKSE